MPSVIDQFLVTLGIDGTQYRRGMDESIRQRQRLDTVTTRGNSERERQERNGANEQRRRQTQQEARIKATVEGYKKIRNELLSIAALFTAGMGIKDFIFNQVNNAAGLGYLSANLKMTTKEIIAYQRASERAGGSAEGIVAQLRESGDALAQLKSGLGPNEGMQNFFRWGGKPDELKDGNSYLLARSRIVHDMFKTDPAQAALIAKQMGLAEEQFDFLKQGPEAIQALTQAQMKNAVITEKDAAAALQLRNRMLDMRDAMQATALRILLQLQPVIERLFVKLEEGAAWLVAHKEDIGQWVDNAVTFFGKAISVAERLANAIGNISDKVKSLTGQNLATTLFNFTPAGILKNIGSAAIDLFSGGSKPAASAAGKASGTPATGARGIRNNNPGNIEYGSFTKARGATGSDGRFARFGTPEAGIGAMSDLLRSYGAKGINTVDSILNRYAPGNENNTAAYSAAVSKKLGVKGSDKLDLNDASVMKRLVSAMIQHENGSNPYSDAALTAGTMSAAQRRSNAMAAGSLPTGASAAMATAGGQAGMSKTEVKIDKIEVHTQATDAAGVAVAMRPAIEKYTFVNQANTGTN